MWKLRRQLEPWRSRTIGAVRRGSTAPTRFQPPAHLELGVTFPVRGRPSAVGSPRCKFARIPPVIQALDETVHPAKAERFVERVLVIDRSSSRVPFIENEPYL